MPNSPQQASDICLTSTFVQKCILAISKWVRTSYVWHCVCYSQVHLISFLFVSKNSLIFSLLVSLLSFRSSTGWFGSFIWWIKLSGISSLHAFHHLQTDLSKGLALSFLPHCIDTHNPLAARQTPGFRWEQYCFMFLPISSHEDSNLRLLKVPAFVKFSMRTTSPNRGTRSAGWSLCNEDLTVRTSMCVNEMFLFIHSVCPRNILCTPSCHQLF